MTEEMKVTEKIKEGFYLGIGMFVLLPLAIGIIMLMVLFVVRLFGGFA